MIVAESVTCSELAVGVVDLKTGIVTNWRGIPNGHRITEFCGHKIPIEDSTVLFQSELVADVPLAR